MHGFKPSSSCLLHSLKTFSKSFQVRNFQTFQPLTSTIDHKSPQFIVTPSNGFLPRSDPLETLPKRFEVLDSLLNRMPLELPNGKPGLLATGDFGKSVEQELQVVDVDDIEDSALLMALFRDYTFATSSYLLEPCHILRRERNKFGQGRSKLPASLAIPLSKISNKIAAKPFMEYAQSYALYNYRRVNKKEPVKYNNLELIRKFSGLKSEHGFILVHVDMVAHTGRLVSNVIQAYDSLSKSDRKAFNESLKELLSTMEIINGCMEGMWKHSSPNDYMKFRTFIMGTKNQTSLFPHGVIYEGVSDQPQFYRGESGANDSIIPTMDNLLQLTQKMPSNELTEILKDFRSYRPYDHTRWLTWVESSSRELNLLEYVKKSAETLTLYILLLDQVRDFRSRHWSFAKEYIIKKTNYPQATGGSPMATWLPNQLSVVLESIDQNCTELLNLQGYIGSIPEIVQERAQVQRKMLQKDVSILTSGGTITEHDSKKILSHQ